MSAKKIIAGTSLALIAAAGWFGYQRLTEDNNETQYVTAAVEKGTLIISLSGSGQVSASNQIDIKPKVSGDVVFIGTKNGKEVKAGTLIAQLNAKDAQKAVRDAEANLESAKLSLEKLKKPADALSMLQAENSLTQAKDNLTKLKLSQETTYQKALESKQKAGDDLKKAHEDGFNMISNAFLNSPEVMMGFENMFFDEGGFAPYYLTTKNIEAYLNQVGSDNRDKAIRYRDDVYAAYNKARPAYTKNFDNYKAASRASDTQTVESLISETYETMKLIADAVKTANNYIDFVQDDMERSNRIIPSLITAHQSKIDSYTGTTNNHLLSLLSIQTTIRTSKETILNSNRDIKEMNQNHPIELSAAEQTIREREGSLAKLKAGADALDIQSSELTLKQRENALSDAKEKLADYFIRTPFDGVIVKFDTKKGDSVSSATVLTTLITRQKIAEVSLNEVDAAKVKTGQKATLTFDAIPDLSITGEVMEVDAVGTVSQGVVTYNVKIAFDVQDQDEQDEKVKPGMSVSAAIITDVRQDVLLVSNSAIKQRGDISYVQIADKTAVKSNRAAGASIPASSLRAQQVQVGLSNDTMTEIIEGLEEGDIVITQTITPNSNQNQSQQSAGFRGSPMPEMMRIMR